MPQKQSKVNKQLEASKLAAEQERNALFAKSLEPSPEMATFRKQGADWGKFIGSKDYRTPPDGSILNFDLWNPTQHNRNLEKARNITGVGASALGGDNSIALQLSRERGANELAQSQANSYENAIKGQDAYFKGQALPYASLDLSKNLSLLNNATGREQFYTGAYVDTAPKPFNWGALLGGVLGGASSLLGNPGLFGGSKK